MQELCFQEIKDDELLSIDGVKWYNAVLTAACGLAGWAVLGIAAVGGAATGAATYHAAKH